MQFVVKLLILSLICCVSSLKTMAPVRSRAPRLANLLKTSSSTMLPTFQTSIKPNVPSTSFSALQPSQPAPLQSNVSGNGDKEREDQDYWQKTNQSHKKNPDLVVTAAAVGASVINDAEEIAEAALKNLNMDMFDEELICDEFSSAIVRIRSKNTIGRETVTKDGSAFIVNSEKHPDLYFVITAAHGIAAGDTTAIQVKHPQLPGKLIELDIQPIFIDKSDDIAIFLIPLNVVKQLKDSAGVKLPAIPAKQLSSVKPHKYEVLALQGYPRFIPFKNFYREKCIVDKPAKEEIDNVSLSGTHIIRSKDRESTYLLGASGGPIIAIRDKQPQVQGILSAQSVAKSADDKFKGPGRSALVTCVGELPRYLQEAEKRAQDLQKTKNTTNDSAAWWNWSKLKSSVSTLLGYK